jgi:Zn-dependent protease with chaperone function
MIDTKAARSPGFFHVFVVPLLWLGFVPIVSLVVFTLAEADLDRTYAAMMEEGLRSDRELHPDQVREGVRFIRTHPLSEAFASSRPEARAMVAQLPAFLQGYYRSLQWLIRIAWFCLLAGAALILFVSLSIPLGAWSQSWQYVSLLVGWHSIRLFLTLEVIAQAILCVGLSFWVTAMVAHFYSLQLILVTAFVAGLAVLAVLTGVFVRFDDTMPVEGEILAPSEAPEFWGDLSRIAEASGTTPPDQVVVGIKDNFFVTENRVTVRGRPYAGKTLFVSLGLLKALDGAEADSILAHEFAHFSGDDTSYSRRIGPLLYRFDRYLAALHEGVLTRPVFACALMIRRLYETSLRRLSREREYRADRVSAAIVSPVAAGNALVRTTAYGAYRREIEERLFEEESPHAELNISQRLETGFRDFSPGFADTAIGDAPAAPHPFDSHPSLGERLRSLGRPIDPASLRDVLATATDGAWYAKIPDAIRRESELWSRYESRFREVHGRSLAYRLLPSTPEEAALVAAAFPAVTLPAKGRTRVVIDHEKISHETWPVAVPFAHLVNITASREWGTPIFTFSLEGDRHAILPLSRKAKEQRQVLTTIQSYWHRQSVAAAYHRDLHECDDEADEDSETQEGED